MKKFLSIISVVLIVVSTSCNKVEFKEHNEKEQESYIEQNFDCEVAFNPIGEILTSESPLTKGNEPTDDIYCVQVYNGTDRQLPFAYGYFDNLESMKLYLKKGDKYRVIVCMIKGAKSRLGKRYDMTNNRVQVSQLLSGEYKLYITSDYDNATGLFINDVFFNKSYCYRGYDAYGSGSYSYYKPYRYDIWADLGKYYYNYSLKIDGHTSSGDVKSINLQKSSSTGSDYYQYYTRSYLLNIDKGILDEEKYPECSGWFYGEVNDYSPTGSYETLDLNFKRVGFGLKYELAGVTDGEVSIKIYNDTKTFLEGTINTSTYSSDEKFFAFYDARSAWEYADNYTENLNVGVSWKRGIGVTQDLGVKTIQIKRNRLNNIKIKLGSDDRGAGVSLNTEAEDSMGATQVDVPIS